MRDRESADIAVTPSVVSPKVVSEKDRGGLARVSNHQINQRRFVSRERARPDLIEWTTAPYQLACPERERT